MKKLIIAAAILGMTGFTAFAGNDGGCKGKGCSCSGSCKDNKCTMKCCTPDSKKACTDSKCMKDGKCTKDNKAASTTGTAKK
jgi:hypothetical protein